MKYNANSVKLNGKTYTVFNIALVSLSRNVPIGDTKVDKVPQEVIYKTIYKYLM